MLIPLEYRPERCPVLVAVGDTVIHGCGSKLNRRGYAGIGPCFHLPGFRFGTGFLSPSHMSGQGEVRASFATSQKQPPGN